MKRLTIPVAALVAAASLAGTAGAANTGQGCVGQAVSAAAHFWSQDDSVKGGFGAEAKALGVTPGSAIQAFSALYCQA